MNIRKSFFIMSSSNYFQIGVQFVSSLVVARLLTPAEFGIFSLSMILVNLANLLRNFGVLNYLVQETHLTWGRLRAARFVNFLLSWSLATGVWLIADWAAIFFREPAIADVIRLLALNFFLIPFGTTTLALLQRTLQFKTIALFHVTGAVTTAIVSIILAWLGYGYFALAWGNVANNIVAVLLLWYVRPRQLQLAAGPFELMPVMRFGVFAVTAGIAHEMAKRAPDLLLGKILNVQAVGLFGRATGLIELLNRFLMSALLSVTMPHFAAQVREQQNVLPSYLTAITHMTLFGWSFLLVVGFLAPQLIPLLYGSQWYQTVILVQILCAGEILLVPFYLKTQVLIATGHIAVETRFALTMLVVRVTVLLLTAPFGLVAATIGFASTNAIAMLLSYRIIRNHLGCTWQQLFSAMRLSIIIVLLMAVTIVLIHCCVTSIWWMQLIGVALVWWLGVLLIPHPIYHEIRWFVNAVYIRLHTVK